MPRSPFSRAFKKSFKVHAAIQDVKRSAEPDESIDAAKVARKLRGQDFDLSQSDADLTDVIEKAATDAGVLLKQAG